MLLQPKKRKFRKRMNKKVVGMAKNGNFVSFGEYGLKAVSGAFISNRQIEAARKVIVRRIKKIGKLRIKIYPDTPITKGGLEMPMGKGKGDVDYYAAKVKMGKVMFEIGGVAEDIAKECLESAAYKLSVKTRFVKRGEIN